MVGKLYQHPLRRTVTQMDNMLFSNMTLNPQPLHIDRHFCEQETEWGQPLMNSLFTLGLMIGIQVSDMTVGTTIANLGMTEVKFPHPLFEGDTVHCTTEVLGKRESKSRPGAGIVDFHHPHLQSGRQAGRRVQAAGLHGDRRCSRAASAPLCQESGAAARLEPRTWRAALRTCHAASRRTRPREERRRLLRRSRCSEQCAPSSSSQPTASASSPRGSSRGADALILDLEDSVAAERKAPRGRLRLLS